MPILLFVLKQLIYSHPRSNLKSDKITLKTFANDLQLRILRDDFNIRVVNFGCWELFELQPDSYKNNIIHDNSIKVSVEAGITAGWERYTGNCTLNTLNIGINSYGESAPGKVVAEHFGLTAEAVSEKIKSTFT